MSDSNIAAVEVRQSRPHMHAPVSPVTTERPGGATETGPGKPADTVPADPLSALIDKLMRHWVDRYGAREVSQWCLKVWNEPNCCIPCDHIPVRSWALVRARDLMRHLIESLQVDQQRGQVAP